MKRMHKITIVDIAYIATFAALIIVLGAVAIPVGGLGVPIVLQNMGILIAAMLLGCLRGGLTTTLFLAVGLIGVPNLAGWRPTISAIAGPTVGYLVGYLIAAFVVGAIADRAPRGPKHHGTRFAIFLAAGVLGVAVQYLCGTLGLMVRLDLDFITALVSNAPFIPGDMIKVALAASIATAVLKAVPDLLRRPTNA